MKTAPADRIVERGLIATALVAAVVRLVQYLANGSLGLDELALSRNIVDRSFADLLGQSLDYGQVAPMGFLAVQKMVTVVLGDSEAALRLLPLVASLALVPVFFWVARRFLGGATLLATVGVFSIAYGFVSYAAAAKQYSTDLLAATALVALAMLVVERRFESRPCLGLAVAGVPLLLLSFSAVPIAAGLGGMLLVMWWRHDEDLPGTGIAAVLVGWGLAASVNVVLALRNVSPETRAYMADFWQSGFVPWGSPLREVIVWLPAQVGTVFDILLFPLAPTHRWEQGLIWLCVVLAGVGAWSLFRRKGSSALFLLCPVVVAVVLAAVHVLPLRERAGLYIAPVLVLLAVEGAASLGRLFGGARRQMASGVVAFLLVGVCSVPFLTHLPPWTEQHIRPVLEEIVRERSPGDTVYAFYGAGQAFAWYPQKVGLGDFEQGRCHRGDVRAYLRELDYFRGGTVWVVFTHVRDVFDELDPILAYLRAIGTQTAWIEDPAGNQGSGAAFAYRFDLTNTVRLSSTTAELFDVRSSYRGSPAHACTGPAADF